MDSPGNEEFMAMVEYSIIDSVRNCPLSHLYHLVSVTLKGTKYMYSIGRDDYEENASIGRYPRHIKKVGMGLYMPLYVVLSMIITNKL